MGSIGGPINTGEVRSLQSNRTQTKKTAEDLKNGFPKTGSEKSLKEFCTANGIKGNKQNFIEAFGKQLNTNTLNPGKRIDCAIQLITSEGFEKLNGESIQLLVNNLTGESQDIKSAAQLLADAKNIEATTTGETSVQQAGANEITAQEKSTTETNVQQTTTGGTPVKDKETGDTSVQADAVQSNADIKTSTAADFKKEITAAANDIAEHINGAKQKSGACDEAFFTNLQNKYKTLTETLTRSLEAAKDDPTIDKSDLKQMQSSIKLLDKAIDTLAPKNFEKYQKRLKDPGVKTRFFNSMTKQLKQLSFEPKKIQVHANTATETTGDMNTDAPANEKPDVSQTDSRPTHREQAATTIQKFFKKAIGIKKGLTRALANARKTIESKKTEAAESKATIDAQNTAINSINEAIQQQPEGLKDIFTSALDQALNSDFESANLMQNVDDGTIELINKDTPIDGLADRLNGALKAAKEAVVSEQSNRADALKAANEQKQVNESGAKILADVNAQGDAFKFAFKEALANTAVNEKITTTEGNFSNKEPFTADDIADLKAATSAATSKLNKAATKIQANFRGALTRKNLAATQANDSKTQANQSANRSQITDAANKKQIKADAEGITSEINNFLKGSDPQQVKDAFRDVIDQSIKNGTFTDNDGDQALQYDSDDQSYTIMDGELTDDQCGSLKKLFADAKTAANNKQKELESAATKIQSRVRGFISRQNTNTQQAGIRTTLNKLNNAKEQAALNKEQQALEANIQEKNTEAKTLFSGHGNILNAGGYLEVSTEAEYSAKVDFISRPESAEIDFDFNVRNLSMCKENLGEARYNDQISNLAARYVNDNPDDAEFKNCPSLKKAVSLLPKSLQDRIQLFKDSKTLMKQKIKDLKASIKTIKSKYNAPLTMTNQLPKLEQALVDLQLKIQSPKGRFDHVKNFQATFETLKEVKSNSNSTIIEDFLNKSIKTKNNKVLSARNLANYLYSDSFDTAPEVSNAHKKEAQKVRGYLHKIADMSLPESLKKELLAPLTISDLKTFIDGANRRIEAMNSNQAQFDHNRSNYKYTEGNNENLDDLALLSDECDNSGLFAEASKLIETAPTSASQKSSGAEKAQAAQPSSTISLTATTVQPLTVDLKDSHTTVGQLKATLSHNMDQIGLSFNKQFGAIFGEINFQQDVLPLFQNSEPHKYLNNISNGEALNGLLNCLDESGKRTFLMDFVYPAMSIDIQQRSLGKTDDSLTLDSKEANDAMQRTASPATKAQLNGFDNNGLINLIRLSFNGLPTNGSCTGSKPASMLSKTQLTALSSMKTAIQSGKTATVKLGAGEGKTFLSMLLPHVLGNAEQPIVHVAPFAQDEEGWSELPDDLSEMIPGKHYWVRQDQLQERCSQAKKNHEDLSVLKDAALFMDEYDRAPALNKALDTIGVTRRVNMSATDNLGEVREKLNNYVIKTENIFGPNTEIHEAVKSQKPNKIKKAIMDEICQLTKQDKAAIQKKLTDNPQDLMTSVETLNLSAEKKMQLKKLIKWYDKVPQLAARNVEQTATELARIDTENMSSTSSSHQALKSMIAKANQDMHGTTKSSIKLQMIFQGAEFVANGQTSETGRAAMSINELQSQLQHLSPKGPTPIHVHMSAPKGLNGFNEGHPITMTYNGSGWTTTEFKKDATGTNVTLYDTFNKVGGDFGPQSRNVDQQYAAVSTDLPDEPLTSSLMYQITKRNRGQQGTRVAPQVFVAGSESGELDADNFRTTLSEKEKTENAKVVQQQRKLKQAEQLEKLFDATVDEWMSNKALGKVSQHIGAIKEALQSKKDQILKECLRQGGCSLDNFTTKLREAVEGAYNSAANEINKEIMNSIIDDTGVSKTFIMNAQTLSTEEKNLLSDGMNLLEKVQDAFNLLSDSDKFTIMKEMKGLKNSDSYLEQLKNKVQSKLVVGAKEDPKKKKALGVVSGLGGKIDKFNEKLGNSTNITKLMVHNTPKRQKALFTKMNSLMQRSDKKVNSKTYLQKLNSMLNPLTKSTADSFEIDPTSYRFKNAMMYGAINSN